MHILSTPSLSLCLFLFLSLPPPPHKAVGEGERAYQIKVLITKPEDLSLIPETHVMEVEDWLLQLVCWALPVSCSVLLYIHIYTK